MLFLLVTILTIGNTLITINKQIAKENNTSINVKPLLLIILIPYYFVTLNIHNIRDY